MAKLTPNQKRCEDCSYVKKGKEWTCDECFGQKIEDIDDCPEGVTVEMIEEIDKQKIKVDTGARAERTEKKASKPRTVVTSDEKKQLFADIFGNLAEIYGENAKIEKENKLIIVKIGEKTFKIDLIEQRKPKK